MEIECANYTIRNEPLITLKVDFSPYRNNQQNAFMDPFIIILIV